MKRTAEKREREREREKRFADDFYHTPTHAIMRSMIDKDTLI